MKKSIQTTVFIFIFICIFFSSCNPDPVVLPTESDLNVPKIRNLTISSTNPLDGTRNYSFAYTNNRLSTVSEHGYTVANFVYDTIFNLARIIIYSNQNNYDSTIINVQYHRSGSSNIYYIDSIYSIDPLTGHHMLYNRFFQNNTNGNKLSFAMSKHDPYLMRYLTRDYDGSTANIISYTGEFDSILSGTIDTCIVRYNTLPNQANLPYQFITNFFWQNNYGLSDIDPLFLLQQSNIFPYRAHDNLMSYHNVPVQTLIGTHIYTSFDRHDFTYDRDTDGRVTQLRAQLYSTTYTYAIEY